MIFDDGETRLDLTYFIEDVLFEAMVCACNSEAEPDPFKADVYNYNALIYVARAEGIFIYDTSYDPYTSDC
jgi:hypothetical protein